MKLYNHTRIHGDDFFWFGSHKKWGKATLIFGRSLGSYPWTFELYDPKEPFSSTARMEVGEVKPRE